MGIKICRMLYTACLVWVFYWNVNRVVIGYALVMWIASELLNSSSKYRRLPHYKVYNALFVGLLIFTTIDRSRREVIPMEWEFRLDVCAHFLFTTITILLICVLALVFFLKKDIRITRLILLAAIAFNIIGFINEFYQNIFKTKPGGLWAIDDESQLDLIVNVISSAICVGWSYLLPKHFPYFKEEG